MFIVLSPYTNGNVGISQIQSVLGSLRGPKNEGKLMIAIRDGENRTYFSGYCVSRYKNFIYVLATILQQLPELCL